jgi:hypothetical protein
MMTPFCRLTMRAPAAVGVVGGFPHLLNQQNLLGAEEL